MPTNAWLVRYWPASWRPYRRSAWDRTAHSAASSTTRCSVAMPSAFSKGRISVCLLIGESQIYVWIKTIESHSLSPQEQAQVWRDAVLNAGAPDNLSFVVLRYDAL